jgi:DTW domain-containing protein
MSASAAPHNRQRDRLFTGREVCERCRRPRPACYCAHVSPIDTRTRLVLLQHPRERDVAIGTAHMASLCLTNSELHVGIDWSRSEAVARALSDPARPAILLYPGTDAIDIVKSPPAGPVTLVVVDGTWAQAKKVVRTNPMLSALPRYAFVPPTPSEYRIRKEPDVASVATIEALVHALTALEGDPERFAALLAPFRAMIDFQLDCQERLHTARSRHAKRRSRFRRMRIPRVLSERLADVVCVAGEANAWPYTMRSQHPAYADELVQWAAHRPATGETMTFIVAPRGEIAPGTLLHTRLDEPTLRSGGTLDELHARWRDFIRDSDVVCSWGRYETNLFSAIGGMLPSEHLDLRHVARDVARGSVGSLADYHSTVLRDRGLTDEHIVDAELLAHVPGRAGHKLRAIGDVVRAFTSLHAEALREAERTTAPP